MLLQKSNGDGHDKGSKKRRDEAGFKRAKEKAGGDEISCWDLGVKRYGHGRRIRKKKSSKTILLAETRPLTALLAGKVEKKGEGRKARKVLSMVLFWQRNLRTRVSRCLLSPINGKEK